MWGIDASAAGYWFAMGYAAALMVGWTFLLIWAFLKPGERRMVAVLTMVVIVGLAVTEIVTAASGLIDVGKVVPTLILQSILLGLFSAGYFKSRSRQAQTGTVDASSFWSVHSRPSGVPVDT